jgi:quercetin dioxygenase-like cupin family protein
MMRARTVVVVSAIGYVVFAALGLAVHAQQGVVWAPKPTTLPGYTSPQRPHVRLSDLKAKHAKARAWSERLVDDGSLQADYIDETPGTKVPRRLHPDFRAWWVVVEGQMRVEIEGQPAFIATKGSVVQVPKQTPYTMETIGDGPSLRFAVQISQGKTLYPRDVEPAERPGFTWVPVRIGNAGRGGYEAPNQPHLNLSEAAKAPTYTGQPAIRDDRLLANLIYGYEKDLPPLTSTEKGHFHPDSPEFWLVMAGQIRYAFENRDAFVADAGDVAYVPQGTFHLARFSGTGPSCRLAITRFTNNSQLVEP